MTKAGAPVTAESQVADAAAGAGTVQVPVVSTVKPRLMSARG
jgi:hypothetical protein